MLGLAAADGDARAERQELDRGRAPDSGSAAGDDDRLAFRFRREWILARLVDGEHARTIAQLTGGSVRRQGEGEGEGKG